MRPRTAALVLLLGLLSAGGCSTENDKGTPAACLEGGDAVLRALRAAPDPVRLSGTPISACLDETSGGSELSDVGTGLLAAAAELSDAAADRPEGPEALRLGYLLGAVRRGSADTQGIGYELIRRLEQERLPVAEGSRAMRRGERAGRRDG